MIAIEIFCCSGGMAEGFRRAGLTFAFAFDYDADACASYEANLHHRPVQIDVRDLVRMAAAGWSPGGQLDLIVADPPCTPWSRAGKRLGLDDERDMLRETCELIRHLRPRHFLIGNIPGLDDGPALGSLRRTIGALSRLGYCIDYARLDAASYGVPQHRFRPFWFGHLAGSCIRWPAPTHGDPTLCSTLQLPGIEPLRPWVTCREALSHLPLHDLGRPVKLRKRGCSTKQHGSVGERPARVVGTSNLSDGNVLLTNGRHPVNRLDHPSFTVTSKGDGRGAQGACVLSLSEPSRDRREHRHPGTKPRASVAGAPAGVVTTRENGDRNTLALLGEWPWNRPATTVTSRPGLAPTGHHDESFAIMSLPEAIVLSEKAAAILQGFPETWVFHGKTKRARWGQIGMAMPPSLAHAVATSVLAAMEVQLDSHR